MLNTLLDDNAYRSFLMCAADELDCMHGLHTPLTELADDLSLRDLEGALASAMGVERREVVLNLI